MVAPPHGMLAPPPAGPVEGESPGAALAGVAVGAIDSGARLGHGAAQALQQPPCSVCPGGRAPLWPDPSEPPSASPAPCVDWTRRRPVAAVLPGKERSWRPSRVRRRFRPCSSGCGRRRLTRYKRGADPPGGPLWRAQGLSLLPLPTPGLGWGGAGAAPQPPGFARVCACAGRGPPAHANALLPPVLLRLRRQEPELGQRHVWRLPLHRLLGRAPLAGRAPQLHQVCAALGGSWACAGQGPVPALGLVPSVTELPVHIMGWVLRAVLMEADPVPHASCGTCQWLGLVAALWAWVPRAVCPRPPDRSPDQPLPGPGQAGRGLDQEGGFGW